MNKKDIQKLVFDRGYGVGYDVKVSLRLRTK